MFLCFLVLFTIIYFSSFTGNSSELFTEEELQNDEKIKELIRGIKWSVDNKQSFANFRIITKNKNVSGKQFGKLMNVYLDNNKFISMHQVRNILSSTL